MICGGLAAVWWAGCTGAALLMLDLLLAVYFVYRMNVGILLFLVLCFVPTTTVYRHDLRTRGASCSPRTCEIVGVVGRFRCGRLNTGKESEWSGNVSCFGTAILSGRVNRAAIQVRISYEG
ncbi:MAG: hypothetical protein MJ014_03405 [Methanocorpusculum sp.]|nr:hypothetical protein [Methanocorpusculum sp.]